MTWVGAQKPGIDGVNIITSDFVELVDFASTVISLNNLLLQDRSGTWHFIWPPQRLKLCWPRRTGITWRSLWLSRGDEYQISSKLALFYILFNRALSAISLIILPQQHVHVLYALKKKMCVIMINILEWILINIKCLFCHIKIYEITISGQEQAGSLSFMFHHEKESILCSVWSQLWKMWTMVTTGTTFLLQLVKNKNKEFLYFRLPQFSQIFGTINTAMMNNNLEFN